MTTGQQLEQARRLLGLSRDVVADRAKVSRSTIQRIEAGDENVSIGRLNAVRKVLEEAGAEFGGDGWIRVKKAENAELYAIAPKAEVGVDD